MRCGRALRHRLPIGEVLGSALGSAGRVRRLHSSPCSRVWIVQLDGSPAVVKQVVGPDAGQRYAREVTALSLAARARPPVVPVLLGTDVEARVLVMECLPDQGPAYDWPVRWAAALARLHAATGPGDHGSLPPWAGPAAADVDAFLRLAGRLGVLAPPQVAGELHRLLDRLDASQHPSQHYALLHGDPCPGNDLYSADGARFFDLDQASLGSGLVEVAYLRIGFPTCWCVTVVPDPLIRRAEQAYRMTGQQGSAWHTGSPSSAPSPRVGRTSPHSSASPGRCAARCCTAGPGRARSRPPVRPVRVPAERMNGRIRSAVRGIVVVVGAAVS